MNRKFLIIALIAIFSSSTIANPSLVDEHETSVTLEDATILSNPFAPIPDTFRVLIERIDSITDDTTEEWKGSREVELELDVDVSRDGRVSCNGVIVPVGVTRAKLDGTVMFREPVRNERGEEGVFESEENVGLEKVMEKGLVDVGFHVRVSMITVDNKIIRRTVITVAVLEINGEKTEENQVVTQIIDTIVESGEVVRRPITTGEDPAQVLDYETWKGIDILPDQINEAVQPVSAMSVPNKVKHVTRQCNNWFKNQTPFNQFAICAALGLGISGFSYAMVLLVSLAFARFRQKSYQPLTSSDKVFVKA